MGFKTLSTAFICLSVISLNSFASPSTELDQIIETGKIDAQVVIQEQLQNNNKLILEITELEDQIGKLKTAIAINSTDTRRDLYIAAGSAIGTMLALKYFGRSTGNEVADSMRILMGIVTAYTGAGVTLISLGASGVNYIQVKIDQKNIAPLEVRLRELKSKLVEQNLKLLN